MNEGFIAWERVVRVKDFADLAVQRRVYSGDGALLRSDLDVAPVVAKMTGLNMEKYDLVPDFDALGWHLVRKETA